LVESRIHKALRERRASKRGEANDNDEETAACDEKDVADAMRVIHRRVLEGFSAWCTFVAGNSKPCCGGLDAGELRHFAAQVNDNVGRPLANLFVEALLIRVLECLGEQMLQCPERIAYLLYKILKEANGMEDAEASTFCIDFEELHDGLTQMNQNSNPYAYKKTHKGKMELGINFDDINESGIQCREEVGKTYREPSSSWCCWISFFATVCPSWSNSTACNSLATSTWAVLKGMTLRPHTTGTSSLPSGSV